MLINEGTYEARVINAVLTERGKDDPQPVIELTVELTGNGLEAPVELSKTFWLGDKPDTYNDNKPEWQVSTERLRELGFVGEDISDLSAVVGFVGRAGVKSKSSDRGAYSVITWIGKGGAKPMDGAKAATFAEKMRARLASLPATGAKAAPARPARPAAPRAQQPKPAAAEPSDFTAPDTSDLPF